MIEFVTLAGFTLGILPAYVAGLILGDYLQGNP